MFKKFLAAIALTTALSLCVNAAEVPNIELNNGTKIPQLGLGTFMLQEGAGESEAYTAVLTALKAGYRHIDTELMHRTINSKWFNQRGNR